MAEQAVRTASYSKNGMTFTYRRYADNRITRQLTRTDNGVVLLAEHPVREDWDGHAARVAR